jgi:hypothetical protein
MQNYQTYGDRLDGQNQFVRRNVDGENGFNPQRQQCCCRIRFGRRNQEGDRHFLLKNRERFQMGVS